MNTTSLQRATGLRKQRAASIFRQGDTWQVVVAEGNGRTRIIESASVPFGDVDRVKSMLAAHRVERIIRVVPAASSIARLVQVETEDVGASMEALGLQAEIQLPASMPAHRRAWGIIRTQGVRGNTGLLTGWLDEHDEPEIPGVETRWTCEITALAGLLTSQNGAVVHGNTEDGSIAIITTDGQNTAIRTLREDHSTSDAWHASLRRAVTETTRGMSDARLSDPSQYQSWNGAAYTLMMPAHLRDHLDGATEGIPNDPTWLSKYGIPLFAVQAWLGAEAGALPLFDLKQHAPVEQLATHERIVRWLSIPTNACATIGICVLLLALSPLLLAGARLAILNSKSDSIEAWEEAQGTIERQLALHKELEQRRWPMTPIAAHLAGATPQDVTVINLRLDAGRQFMLEGRAPSDEVVNELQANLNDLGLFGPVTIDSIEPGDRGVEFSVVGTVERPYAYRSIRYGTDYTEETLAIRLYGVETNDPDGDFVEATASSSDARGSSGSSTRVRSSGSRRERAPTASESRASAEPVEIPPPVTPDLLAGLTNSDDAFKMLQKYLGALKTSGLDDGTRTRLNEDKDQLMARWRELR